MNQLKVRLDIWLWAARFYKTRSLSAKAIKRGHINVNDQKAKPATQLALGDRVRIRRGQLIYEVQLVALSQKRLSASLAKTLYSEHASVTEARHSRLQEIKAARLSDLDGKPTKRQRRQQRAIKRQLTP